MIELCGLPMSPRQTAAIGAAHLDARHITGLAAPYGVLSAPFEEDGIRAKLLPGCFRDVVNERCELWVSHSERIKLATTTDGTLTLTEGADGLHIEATLPADERGEVARLAIARKAIVGLSIHFQAAPGCSRTYTERGVTVWEVSRVGWLREVSLARTPRFPQTFVRCAPYRDQRDANESRRITRFFSTLYQ